ncbi:MAG TPA: hypothetical protein VMS38_24580, partial [Pseudorhodoferax sp.]|nr:hypothetical protein [Pseudorhodoferax sp.]
GSFRQVEASPHGSRVRWGKILEQGFLVREFRRPVRGCGKGDLSRDAVRAEAVYAVRHGQLAGEV